MNAHSKSTQSTSPTLEPSSPMAQANPTRPPVPTELRALDHLPQLSERVPEQQASAAAHARYDDIAQDGRWHPVGLINAAEGMVWSRLLIHHPFFPQMRQKGIIPILSRMTLASFDGPFEPSNPIELRGGFEMAHSRTDVGDVSRVVMNVCSEAFGPLDAHRAGERTKDGPVLMGRAFLEHTFTRLHAPPHARKVTEVEWAGHPAVPRSEYPQRPPQEVLEVHEDVEWLEDVLRPADFTHFFGLIHTDLNQHVNSLVYPRLFEEQTLRRLAEHGVRAPLLARFVEVAYRKPSFAGEYVRFFLRTFQQGGRYGAVGFLLAEGEAVELGLAGRGRCYLRMLLEP